ncbi:MAG: class I adenylate-forming enzyme family protein [Candidatus Binatia bacterium]|nr:class I adenylate-forming enzyme family protein [Candidatus Binatia bacterium]
MIAAPPEGVRTLVDLIIRGAERFGDREAVVFGDTRWSYDDLARETGRVAHGLLNLGLRPGERVGVLLPNWPEFFACVFGIQAAGGTAVCLNTMAAEAELRQHVERTELVRILYTPRFLKHDYVARLDAVAQSLDSKDRLTGRIAVARAEEAPPPGSLAYDRLGRDWDGGAAALRALDRSAASEPAAIFFTSGSTAEPKAVVHAHRALVHQAYVAGDAFGVTSEDRAWGSLPLFFTGGFVVIGLLQLAAGGAVVLQDHFDAGTALDLMERERITFYAGWQQAPALCDHESFGRRRLDLRKGMYADSPVAERLLARGHVSIQGYGLSETATTVCTARWDDPPDVRTRGFGRPLPGVEIAIVDVETGERRPEGEIGEVRLRGPSLMLGYLGVAREESFDSSGYFRTGDLGRIDESGTLCFEGRLKDVIKTAGVNVAAAEIEAFLGGVAGVRAAYVVPVAHSARGQNVGAFVVMSPEAPLDVPRLLARCREGLASYKVPRHVFELSADSVPRTGTLKVDKPQLRKQADEWADGPRDLIPAGSV